eukprot:3667474-Rhodomonas_salina.1
MDVTTDGFGFMLCFGDLVRCPIPYAHALCTRPMHTPYAHTLCTRPMHTSYALCTPCAYVVSHRPRSLDPSVFGFLLCPICLRRAYGMSGLGALHVQHPRQVLLCHTPCTRPVHTTYTHPMHTSYAHALCTRDAHVLCTPVQHACQVLLQQCEITIGFKQLQYNLYQKGVFLFCTVLHTPIAHARSRLYCTHTPYAHPTKAVTGTLCIAYAHASLAVRTPCAVHAHAYAHSPPIPRSMLLRTPAPAVGGTCRYLATHDAGLSNPALIAFALLGCF